MDIITAFEFCGAVFMYCLTILIVIVTVFVAFVVVTYAVESVGDEKEKTHHGTE